jgi:hypothetical protein
MDNAEVRYGLRTRLRVARRIHHTVSVKMNAGEKCTVGRFANDTTQWCDKLPMRCGSHRDGTQGNALIPAVRKSMPSTRLEAVMRFAGAAAITLCIYATSQAANAQIEQIEGKSIIVSYRETVYTSSGKIFVNNLSERCMYLTNRTSS